MEVENGCIWKGTTAGDTPIFHWTKWGKGYQSFTLLVIFHKTQKKNTLKKPPQKKWVCVPVSHDSCCVPVSWGYRDTFPFRHFLSKKIPPTEARKAAKARWVAATDNTPCSSARTKVESPPQNGEPQETTEPSVLGWFMDCWGEILFTNHKK